MLSYLPFKAKLTLLFCLLDDFLALLPNPQPALPSGKHPAGRPSSLSAAEVLTLPSSVSGASKAIGKPFIS